ncbi:MULTISPECIES: hypothetical protein [Bacillus cereus group]|uniref:Uncharacterized protein n=1 Tax=Bacillus cereus TaxID=1396 RepID=A0AA44Q5G0_BACCE|nr:MULTISPECIES: hypothetical protein [Bacillus cereus group]EEL51865.1 hypothetical protein bcere0022_7790 [Bacillus cereus Rock3-44]PFA24793.1 hypothetical protein CN373_02810 [Bacillus cereus]PFN09104.1 hypothetical protein COJ55_03730 [Bacillus cereus]PFO82992.1 hypothetical protein COJ77_10310 [Bacillus cereus]PFR83254.1 hypothetical protein COK38_26840 [Bacillus cereus]
MVALAFIFGAIFIAWGFYRIKNDFRKNKKKNNIISFLLQGGASGIGQLVGGIIFIIIGIFALITK